MHTRQRVGRGRKEYSCTTVVDHRAQLGERRPGVDRHCHVTSTQCGEIGDDELDAVRADDGDPMPRHESARGQTRSDLVDSAVELGPGHGAAYRPRLNQRDPIGLSHRLPRDKIGKVGLQLSNIDQLER